MKKLMFAAALVASSVAFAGFEMGLDAEDGVYNITLSQKTLEPKFDVVDTFKVNSKDNEDYFETADEAKAYAKEFFESEYGEGFKIKSITTRRVTVEGEKLYAYTMTIDELATEPTSAKVVTSTVNGITIVGGEYDGAIVTWLKDKSNRSGSYYLGYGRDDLTVGGQVLGNKSVGVLSCGEEGDLEYLRAIGTGTAVKDTNKKSDTYGEYIGVKSISGSTVALYTGEEGDETYAYGTWKLAKDTTCSALLKKGYSLDQILLKKGVVEVNVDDAE